MARTPVRLSVCDRVDDMSIVEMTKSLRSSWYSPNREVRKFSRISSQVTDEATTGAGLDPLLKAVEVPGHGLTLHSQTEDRSW